MLCQEYLPAETRSRCGLKQSILSTPRSQINSILTSPQIGQPSIRDQLQSMDTGACDCFSFAYNIALSSTATLECKFEPLNARTVENSSAVKNLIKSATCTV